MTETAVASKTTMELFNEQVTAVRNASVKKKALAEKITFIGMGVFTEEQALDLAFTNRDIDAVGSATKAINGLKNTLAKVQAELLEVTTKLIYASVAVSELADQIAAE